MRKLPFPLRELCVLCASVVAVAVQSAEFELKDGDRIALIGGTFIERDQQYGYLETLLTTRFHDRKLTFRNLGWSGDNLLGESRAGFGKPEDGFRALEKMVKEVQPTKIIFNYGMSESFEGPAGLEKFKKNLDRMLDMLSKSCPNICILSPQSHEKLPAPLPDPAEHNMKLRLYSDVLKAVAEKRGHYFIDLFALLPQTTPKFPVTDDGLQFTPYGHFRAACTIEKAMGYFPYSISTDISRGKEVKESQINCTIRNAKVTDSGITFEREDTWLPVTCTLVPGSPPRSSSTINAVSIRGFPKGKYTLKIDGKPVACEIGASEENQTFWILSGPEFDQSEKLRQLINEKNQLFFHRWRPQNETYIFGFRKHEQGKNAADIPQFDPLIAAKEDEIRKLAKPVPHTYTIEPLK